MDILIFEKFRDLPSLIFNQHPIKSFSLRGQVYKIEVAISGEVAD